MSQFFKKFISYILILIVLVFTVISLLGVWEIIDLDNVIRKLLGSLLIVFAASAVILFIFSIVSKNDDGRIL